MLLEIHPDNPQDRLIKQVVEVLRTGGIIIYPTDTVYALGCAIDQSRSIEKICTFRGLKPEKAQLSIICSDLSHLSGYVHPFNSQVYRLMKEVLPGPYTFILKAGSEVPRLLHSKRKTIGIRVPDHKVPLTLVRELGCPIITTSLHIDDTILEYPTDPEAIYEDWKGKADLVIHSGPGGLIPSTVVDCTTGIEIVRNGKGDLSDHLIPTAGMQ